MSERPGQQAAAEPLGVKRQTSRPLWVFLGALVMGGIGIGLATVAMRTGILARFQSPVVQFWVFELGTALGYFVGGFGLALLSPGRTTREPMMAAVFAFVAQSVFLWYFDWVAMTAQVFFVMLALSGALAWLGAYLGERMTGAK